ncbi:MAG: 5-(carboxyamino)imidazole ribonucleotide synthase [Acidimicrobiaceae bacterium]|nr:5-(carboxyamino)imidazole ribonucleotide synthase [Acidimicrobiaceae bacterium]
MIASGAPASLPGVSRRRRVGVVGGGQLARMMVEAAEGTGVDVVVLAEHSDDSATGLGAPVLLGQPRDPDALGALIESSDVLTFDHELLDLDLLESLERSGVIMHPSPAALRWATDKAHQRRGLEEAGIRVPRFEVVSEPRELERALAPWPSVPVVKAASGGYDGRGVVVAESFEEARARAEEFLQNSPVVLEERLDLLAEVSQLVVRSTSGEVRAYPLVTTVQVEGMCAEVLYPAPGDVDAALEVATRIAHLIDLVGVMAVELFVTPRGLLVNEIALRPHNSGHWTIEGCRTSQFESHLRAVAGLDLGETTACAGAVAMVNLVGAARPSDDGALGRHSDVAFHLYGKTWRPGRKLGHVTALGPDLDEARTRAWAAARDWGTRERGVE